MAVVGCQTYLGRDPLTACRDGSIRLNVGLRSAGWQAFHTSDWITALNSCHTHYELSSERRIAIFGVEHTAHLRGKQLRSGNGGS